MATYRADALYFTTTDEQDFTVYEGVRRLRIETDDAGFSVGEDLGDEFIFDETDNREVDPDDTEFGRFEFTADGSLRQGIYFELSGSLDTDSDGLFEDVFGDDEDLQYTYRILAEGDPLPELTPGQPIDEQFPALGIGEFDLDDVDGRYEEGSTIRFEEIVGLQTGLFPEEIETVALLYEAGLNRMPDVDGLNYWIDQREAGLSETGLAGAFIASQEFRETVGDPATLSNEQYVDQLYLNVLDREADAEGEAFWTASLDAGGLSREQLLIEFAESQENRENADYLANLTEVSEGEYAFA